MKGNLKACLNSMAYAGNYAEWCSAAKEHDRLSGADEWKEDDASGHYDYRLIRHRYNELRAAREAQDVNQLVFSLNEVLHGNLGRIANTALYDSCYFGTKRLITEFLDEVVAGLEWVCNTEFPHFSLSDKIEFFERTNHSFGQSALMLSGGATLGLFHLGVIKALLDEDLLPNVVSGSSAGALLSGVVGTHTREELEVIFDPEYLYVEAFRTTGWKNTLKGRSVMDPGQLELCLERNVKDMTFKEAFELTGRKINITVSPADPHQEARLLNALTSPDVLIRKACMASAAIPYVFPPVMLWAKNMHGEKCPYIPSRQWVDGSIKDDLPAQSLARLYGVNHTIVSQTNPHIVPFLSRKDRRPNIFGYVRGMATENLRYNLSQVLEIVKNRTANQQVALLLDKAHSVVNQKYVGDINIVPPRRPSNVFRVVSNAKPSVVAEYIRDGQQTTWPRIERVRNTTLISRTIQDCLKQLKMGEVRRTAEPVLALV